VLPVALSYDFLRRGRPRVLVRFGPLRDDFSGLDRRQTNQTVQQAVLELWTVNASHLAANYLLGEKAMRLERRHHQDLDRFVAEMAERCQTLGVPIDPDLLDTRKRQTRIKDCLSFCRKRKSQHAKRELMFLNNELQAIAAIHPGLLADHRQ